MCKLGNHKLSKAGRALCYKVVSSVSKRYRQNGNSGESEQQSGLGLHYLPRLVHPKT